ncbi:MAG: tetraacyldisaccharide 4'-kinase [Bacteroides sp.]|nr:tetraacyldisaccharide 4'-kinase [Bacteroides sp.]MCM1378612.1 tetraacyldisaccharide 4'-kinase [Bacteroides sp.]MCM1444913.1 tetraacyldisaccharide 4'-kinase [Prevotella sp.]
MSKTSKSLLKGLLLKPLAVAYGAVTATRNKMFDVGVLEQRSFDIPVLVVGNIAVGGTGKTPHVEFLVELLHEKYRVGVLSRGYNRRTKGFRLATAESNAREIGDEPYQIFRKFGQRGVMVAVCEDRCKGIDKMRELDPTLNLIILDDAFQHRYVKPTVSVVLTEHSRPVFEDSIMPAGHLREHPGALHRADIIVVTKCPDDMKQIDYRIFTKNMNLYPYQQLFFSKYAYGELTPLFPEEAKTHPTLDGLSDKDTVVVVAGIANPKPFVKRLKQSKAKVRGLIFSDHHNFTRDDIAAIIEKIKTSADTKRTIVVTTEKDAMRLRDFPGLPPALKRRIFYMPVSVKFISADTAAGRNGTREFAEAIMTLLRRGGQQ